MSGDGSCLFVLHEHKAQNMKNIKYAKNKMKSECLLRHTRVYGNGGIIGNVFIFAYARYAGNLKHENNWELQYTCQNNTCEHFDKYVNVYFQTNGFVER